MPSGFSGRPHSEAISAIRVKYALVRKLEDTVEDYVSRSLENAALVTLAPARHGVRLATAGDA